MSPVHPDLHAVPATMLAEYGVRADQASAWRCEDPAVELVPVAALRVPARRGLDPERLRRLLSAVAGGHPLPAVPVFREPDAVLVLDGAHRVALARAGGFTHVLCLLLDENEARAFYRYPEGQR